MARDFLLSFPVVNKKVKNEYPSIKIDLYATTLKYNDECFGYSKEIERISEEMSIKHKNIHLIELVNGSSGTKSYGSIENWKNACISGATFLYTLTKLKKYDRILALCVDTPFAKVPNYFFDQYHNKIVDFIWLPQSTVLIHKIDSAIGISEEQEKYVHERFEWEKAVVDLSKINKQVKIGCVGHFMKQHLLEKYEAETDRLVDIQNGVNFKRINSYKMRQKDIASILKRYQVPLNRPLLFSFGRGEPYKGLDLILKNAIPLIKSKKYFVLILASPYSMDDDYVKDLQHIANQYPSNMRIVFGLDFLTPHYIMQWKNTKIVALLSRAEPFGLIPIESRSHNNKNLTLIASNIDGYVEQITSGTDGFLVDLEDNEIQKVFLKISELSSKEKAFISAKGYAHVISDYNQENINFVFLNEYIASLL